MKCSTVEQREKTPHHQEIRQLSNNAFQHWVFIQQQAGSKQRLELSQMLYSHRSKSFFGETYLKRGTIGYVRNTRVYQWNVRRASWKTRRSVGSCDGQSLVLCTGVTCTTGSARWTVQWWARAIKGRAWRRWDGGAAYQ